MSDDQTSYMIHECSNCGWNGKASEHAFTELGYKRCPRCRERGIDLNTEPVPFEFLDSARVTPIDSSPTIGPATEDVLSWVEELVGDSDADPYVYARTGRDQPFRIKVKVLYDFMKEQGAS